MNWANKITTVRIILLPIIIILMVLSEINWGGHNNVFLNVWNTKLEIGNVYKIPLSYLIAGILFIIASFSDMLDGYIARKYNQVTVFGKFFDAIADKLLTNIVIIVMAYGNFIPLWMAIILIARDFLIDVVRQILASSNIVMAANKMGKIRAATEMLGLSILFFLSFNYFGGTVKGTTRFDFYGYVNQIILIPMYIATLLGIFSAFNYIYLNRKTLFFGALENKKDKKDEN